MKKLLIITAILALVGCEMARPYPAMPEARWYKKGATTEIVRAKRAKCIYDVGMNKVEATERETLIESCMIADGFIWGIPPEEMEKWKSSVERLKKQGYSLY